MTTFPHALPILGILNDTEAPSATMVVVVYGKPNALRWRYVAHKSTGNGDHPYQRPDEFTSLNAFGVVATMAPDGRLALHQLTISTARYHNDGHPRRWQGDAVSAIDIHPHAAGYVQRAVALEWEQRRAARRETAAAQ